MSIKNQRVPVKKVRRRQYKTLTDANKIEILNMYNVQKKSQAQIAEHFGTSRQNINRILKKLHETNIEIKNDVMLYSSDEVLKRRSLNLAERHILATKDALEATEIAMSLIKYKLNVIINSVVAGKENGHLAIDIDKIMKLLQPTLPYVLPKQDGKEIKKPGEIIPRVKLHHQCQSNSYLNLSYLLSKRFL